MSVSEPAPPSSGSSDFIGDYQVLELLGRGGMGEVFLAWDERLQRRVAIKRIRHDGEVSPTLRQRLLREAQAVASLSHSAIVHVYELLKDDAGDDCIVMEYVEGRTVAAALEDGPLDPLTAVRLALEIASGLAAAHEAGIVHRDLKAENVIITPAGHAKILDFGLAKPLVPANGDPTLTMSGLVLGTCRSMSPEQAKGAEVDGRSDLFSLGVLLYEMLTGQPPFRGSGALEVLTQVISKNPPRVDAIRPAVPPRLGTLIERLLEKEPASRPHSAAEVVRELAAIEAASGSAPVLSSEETISELPTGYHPASSPPPSQPQARSGGTSGATTRVALTPRQRGIRIAVLVILGAVVLGIAVYCGHTFFEQSKGERSPNREDHSLLEEKVIRKLRNGKSDDSSREQSRRAPPTSGGRSKDKGAFSKIQRDLGKVPVEILLKRLNLVLTTSPGFLDAKLLTADLYITEFYSNRDSQYLDSAEMLVDEAGKLATPTDARPLLLQFKIEMARGHERDAKDTLRRLEKLTPGEPQLLLLRSQLAELEESEEAKAEAVADLRRLLEQRSTWENFILLVELEARVGRITDARNHLKQALTEFPDNLWALEEQATIELLYGDITKAEQLFEDLTERDPQNRVYYTNLGNAQVLLKRYEEAFKTFTRALSLAQDNNVAATINLADMELALDREPDAQKHYSEALQHLKAGLNGASFTPTDYAIQAQCLAHLNDFLNAKIAIERALDRHSDDGDILQAAALVYTLMGERDLAVANIKRARARGVQRGWFELPVYALLRGDPDYERALREEPARELGATSSR
jgi:serine/threonine protein kinase/predicted Zn-dependent protease